MRWRTLTATAGVCALAAVAACGAPSANNSSDGKTDYGKSQSDKIAVDTTDAKAPAPAPEVPGAVKGGTITVASGSTAPSTLDPTRTYYTDSGAIMKVVTRTLTQYIYRDGKMILVPDLATDLGRPNKDFTRWEFTLRDGIKYEDGTPVTSKDLAYAIKRQFALAELPDGPVYGLDYFLDGDKYQGPWKSGDNFRAVETPDDKTLVIKMRKPFADLRFFAAYPDFAPIPQAKDTKEEYGEHPLATGPYKFGDYQPGKSLTLVRNKYWDPKTDPVRRAYPDKWVFKFAVDPTKIQKAALLDQGDAQTTVVPDDVLAEIAPQIQQKDPKRLLRGPGRCVSMYYMDMRLIPYDVRKAIAVATPIDSLNKVSGSVPGLNWSPGTSIMPKNSPGWKSFDAVGTGGKGDGDPAKAKAMLKKAGKLGFQLSWRFSSDDPLAVKSNQVKTEAYEKAGFKVKSIPVTKAQARSAGEKDDKKVNMRSAGWCPDWPGGGSIFPAQWDPRKNNTPGIPNPAFPQIPGLGEKIDKITAMPPEKAFPAWGELDKWIMTTYLPAVPIGEGDVTGLAGSKIGNAHIDASRSMPDYTAMYVKG